MSHGSHGARQSLPLAMEGEQEVGKSETKCKAEVKRGQVESDTVLPRGPPFCSGCSAPTLQGSRTVGILFRTWSMT